MAEMYDKHDYLEQLQEFVIDATKDYAITWDETPQAVVYFTFYLLNELTSRARKDGATPEQRSKAHRMVIEKLTEELDYYRSHGGVWRFQHELGTRDPEVAQEAEERAHEDWANDE